MLQQITVKRLGAVNFFKLCLIGNTVSFGVVWITLSIFALVGSPLVRWEDEYITGTMTIIAGPVVVAALGLLFSVVQSLFAYIGLLIYSRYKNITLSYLPETVPETV